MMKIVLFLAASALLVAGCSSDGTDDGAAMPVSGSGVEQAANAMGLTEHEAVLAAPLNDYSLDLFRQVAGGQSLVVSPLGTAFVLGMLCEGADAKAGAEILSALRMEGEDTAAVSGLLGKYVSRSPRLDDAATLVLANNVTVSDRYRMSARYAQRVETLYGASVLSLDFSSPEALDTINRWSDCHSGGLIPQIIDRLDASAVACLLGALYFKAAWKEPFSRGDSRTAHFTTADGTAVECRMMHRTGNAEYCELDGMKALRLPLGNGSYAMTLLLPGAADGLPALLSGLDASRLATLPFAAQRVRLSVPSFELSTSLDLIPPLKALGVSSVFDSRSHCLTNMLEDASALFVSLMNQKVKMGLNEEGTEAAAVTIAEVVYTSALGQHTSEKEFRADHPFAFIISKTSTGTIFFTGQYTGK